MKIIVTCLMAVTVIGLLLNDSLAASEARITLKVVDDEGASIAGFPVKGGFYKADKFQGLTDTNGLFVMDGQVGYVNEANWIIQKEGYYYGYHTYAFKDTVSENRLQPWNPVVTTIVRRVVHPIPANVRHVETRIPRTNESFGYDMMVADWVQPVGKGVVSDLVFTVQGIWKDARNYDDTLTLTFPQLNDGIIPVHYNVAREVPTGSALYMPREAPINGYGCLARWHQFRGIGDSSKGTDSESGFLGRGYLLRIRSVTNAADTIVSAIYGEIPNDVRYTGNSDKPSSLYFTYYLNPTPNDRNLEFDLFTTLNPKKR